MLKLLKLSPLNDERAPLVIFFFLTVLFLCLPDSRAAEDLGGAALGGGLRRRQPGRGGARAGGGLPEAAFPRAAALATAAPGILVAMTCPAVNRGSASSALEITSAIGFAGR